MDQEAFRSELATRMVPAVTALETYLGPVQDRVPYGFASLRQSLIPAANFYAQALQEPDLAEEAAMRLCVALFGPEAPPDDFWTGEVGPAIALVIGYPHQVAPRSAAATILRVSRQRVHELVDRGVLEAGELADGPAGSTRTGITARSLRDRLRATVRA